MFENELPPIREVSRTKLKEITELLDGSVKVQFAPSTSSSHFSFTFPRSEAFQTFKDAAKQPSKKFKRVDFGPNIPKTHYVEEDEDSNHNVSETPTLSVIRSQRNQLNVIYYSIDRKHEFKKVKNSIVRSFRKTLKRLNSKEELKTLWEEFYSYPKNVSFFK
ncbi:hypothetical protein Adt_18377 [Abeliophyllum distichum]|uniref:Uncharacterized protein n=1 Tax=Abeliophyllum distichum TaxID=126358 RepID=A0ABD1TJ80_9LAMI